MTTTFMLPLAIGACGIIGGNESILLNAYGIVALIALTPLITIQVFGLLATKKSNKKHYVMPKEYLELFESDIIELDVEI